MSSSSKIRHRTTARHVGDDAPVVAVPDSPTKYVRRQHNKLHVGVWARVIAIVSLFTAFALLVSRVGRQTSGGGDSGGVRAGAGGGPRSSINGNRGSGSDSGKTLFVTILMPSVVKPQARPLRLTNIAKTWGPSARAIYVVHDLDEYPDGEEIDTASKSSVYPQNLLVPKEITVDKGVERLEHVIRTVHKDIDPDFAFFANDHTFVLPDHLCQFLKEHDPTKDLYAGHALKGKGESAFNSGAAGYVLSRTTMERLIKEWDDPKSKCALGNASKWLQGNPGLLTAKCFEEVLKVPVLDTRDERDRSHKFHAYGLVRTVTGKVDDWYRNKHVAMEKIFGEDSKYHVLPEMAKCCSTRSVSFHYVEAGESLAFWEVMRRIHKSPSMSDDEIKELMNEIWPRDKEGLGGYAHGLPGDRMGIWHDIISVVRKISVGVAPPSC